MRLSDIDPQVRASVARRLSKLESDPFKQLELLEAAAHPSDDLHFVDGSAAPMMPHLLTAEACARLGVRRNVCSGPDAAGQATPKAA